MTMTLMTIHMGSCQKSPINGDLDGQWQVMDVIPAPPDTIIPERLYYCFALHVCQLTKYGGGFTTGNMLYEGNRLWLEFPHAGSIISQQTLKQYGIYSNPVTFTVEHLDKKKLVLRDGDVTVTMRKF